MVTIAFDVILIEPDLEKDLKSLLARLANVFSRLSQVKEVEIEPLSLPDYTGKYHFDNGKFKLKTPGFTENRSKERIDEGKVQSNGKFKPKDADNTGEKVNENKRRTNSSKSTGEGKSKPDAANVAVKKANEDNKIINGGKVLSREDDPSCTRWRGSFSIKGEAAILADIFEKMCNTEESKGMIFSFPDHDETIFKRMIGVTNQDYDRHQSKLKIESFAMGTLINGTKFCSHFHSRQMMQNSYKKISHDPRDLILRFDHTSKKVILFLKVSGNETKDTIEIERFKLVYEYQSIKNVFVKKSAKGIVHLYFHLTNAPQIWISKRDYIRKDLYWSDPRKIPKKGDYVYCEEETKIAPFLRWDDCSIIPSDIIGRSNVVEFVVKEEVPNIFYHPPLPALSVWKRYHELKIHFVNIEFKEFRTYPDIFLPPLPFIVNYALKCLHSQSFQFQDDLHGNNIVSGFKKFITGTSQSDGDSIVETLYRLFYLLSGSQVYHINLMAQSVHLKVLQEEELQKNSKKEFKNKSNDRIRYLRRAVLTPTRVLFYPPVPFLINRFLDVADPEYAIRLSLRDENFSNLGYAVSHDEVEDEEGDDITPASRERRLEQRERELQRELFRPRMSRADKREAERKLKLELDMFEKDSNDELLARCILRRISPGLHLCHRSYEYLGASTSQLRDHGMVLYAKDSENRTAEDVRKSLGTVLDTNVSKYIARVGLSLSSVISFIEAPSDLKVDWAIPDIKGGKHPESGKEFNFTDGVGKISIDMARYLYDILIGEGVVKCDKEGEERYEQLPSAYQIRFRGCKGMICIDPTLQGKEICLRPSMRKVFESESSKIGILKLSEPRRAYLNRPLVTILNQIGLRNEFFIKLLLDSVRDLMESFMMDKKASKILQMYCNLNWFIDHKKLVDNGYQILQDPLFRSALNLVFHHSLQMIKQKARIPLDMSKARTMFGVVDETNTLEYGQIFAFPSLTDEQKENGTKPKPLQGPVIVTKFPCMHPGDVRKLKAVDVPALHHIKDCIVFPAKGPRPHSNEMAGSDLDGDEYCVIWQKEFLKIKIEDPMIFPDPEDKPSSDPITNEAIIDFYIKYLQECAVGKIASAHLVWADCLSDGVFSETCMNLAEKYSISLDFAKTGVTRTLTRQEKYNRCPDFMEKWDEKPTYLSHRALGKMYRMISWLEVSFREVDDIQFIEKAAIDQRLVHSNWKNYEKSAKRCYKKYQGRLYHLLERFGFDSEMELLSNVRETSLNFKERELDLNKPNDSGDILKTITNETLIKVIESEFEEEFSSLDNSDTIKEKKRAKASAIYMITHEMNETAKRPIYGLPWIGSHGKYLIELLARGPKDSNPVDYTGLYSKMIDEKLSIDGYSCQDFEERLRYIEIVRKSLLKWLDSHLHLVGGLRASKAEIKNRLEDVYRRVSLPFTTNFRSMDSPGRIILETFQVLWESFLNATLPRESLQHYGTPLGLLALSAYQRLFHTSGVDHILVPKLKVSRRFLVRRTLKETIKNHELINQIAEKNRDKFIEGLKDISGVHHIIITPPKGNENFFTVFILGSPVSVLSCQRIIASYCRGRDPNDPNYRHPLDRL